MTTQQTFRFTPEGGLNWDDGDYAFPEGDYRYAQDLLFDHEAVGGVGAATLVPGTRPFEIMLPAGVNKTIGYYEDRRSRCGLVFNCNSEGNHAIYELEARGEVAEVMFEHPLLNFHPDYPITGAAVYVIYKDGVRQRLLYFTDNYNPVRCLNLETLRTLLHPSEYEPRFLNLAKSPPLLAPLLLHDYPGDGAAPPGPFSTGLVQMVYRYVYHDFQESAWSPISKPMSAAYFKDGLHHIKAAINNDVIPFAAGGEGNKYWKLIAYAEVAVRFSAREPFRRWVRLRPDSGPIGPALFRNDGAYPAIADISWLRNYDAVPHRAVGLAGIDNRIVLGSLTESFPEHELQLLNVGSRSYPQSFDALNGWQAIQGDRMAFKNGSLSQLGVAYYDEAGRTPGVYTDEFLKVEVPVGFTRNRPHRYAKTFSIVSPPPVWAYSFQLVRTESLTKSWFVQGVVEDIAYIRTLPDAGLDQSPTLIKRQIGLTGVQDGAAWVYSKGDTGIGDNLRRIGRTSDHAYYAQLDTPIYEGGVDAEGKELVVIRTDFNLFGSDHNEMRNEPIGRTATGAPIFIGGYDKAPIDETRAQTIEYMSTAELGDAQYLGVNIRNWSASSAKSVTESYPSNEIYYNFEKGDRLDLLYGQRGEFIGVLNLEIVDFRDGMLLVPVTAKTLPQLNIALGRGALVEVFKPRGRDQEPLFYEYGESFRIDNPGTAERSHQQSAFEVYLGDTHLVQKQQYATGFSTAADYWVYSMHPDPKKTYEFWERGHGRALVAAKHGIRTNPTELRYSGKVFSDGQVNETARFDATDSVTYPSEYGDLVLLVPGQNNMVQDTGNILLAQFQNEAVSIYVNRTTLQDLSGRTQVLQSDKVLGSYNTLLGSHGLRDAQASVGVDSRRYWWDDYNGFAVRYSRDGLTKLKAKMHSYFQTFKNKGLTARAGYDNANDMFLLTLGNRTIAWSEGRNRWVTFFSFLPELYGQLGGDLVSFIGGVPHRHTKGDYNTYYGAFHQPRLELLFNARPGAPKDYMELRLVSHHAWDAQLSSSFKTGGRREQVTKVAAAGFESNEEQWEASVPRDLRTPHLDTKHRALNGDPMRSSRLRVLLDGAVPAGEWSALFEVSLEYAGSKPEPLGK